MAITIPKTVFANLVQWMAHGPWPGHLQQAIHDHLHRYCDRHDLDTFNDLAGKIGRHWVTCLNDIAMNDFLCRDTEDGNVVDLYLKDKQQRRKEKPIPKAYLRGIRQSVMSLYEVSDIRRGQSFMARDLTHGRKPFRVEERSATRSLAPGQHMAMRIVEVRGQWIVAGGMLPFEPNLSEAAIEQIHWLAGQAEAGLRKVLYDERTRDPAPEVVREVSMAMALKVSSPLICDVWLNGTMQDSADMTEGVCA